MKNKLIIILMTLMTFPAFAETQPNDVISILKMPRDERDSETIYQKKFKDLSLDAATFKKFARVEARLFADYGERVKLHSIRLDYSAKGHRVSRAMFKGKCVFAVLRMYNQKLCITGITGNGTVLHVDPKNCI